ncbi:MAG TPA: hypothetical protein H9887_08010 [Candidatus Dorea intestinavium]|nr:hypothetical protein [Candidatus Dorea intestinavium]
MKNKWIKPLSITLSVTLLISGLGFRTYAVNSSKDDKETKETTKTLSTSSSSDEELDVSKNEAVYALTNANGSVNKIIVSDWIKNNLGDDSYTEEDVKKELPVDLSMVYKLDGKEISPEDLAGKSGKVSIRVNYKNNITKTVTVDGKEEKVHVPFVMLTGMLLENEKFQNVEVSNGKLVNDGDHTAVMGLAFPGLSKDLDLNTDKLEIPDYVEITADVKDFEMTNTMTLATNEIFSRLDTKELDSVDDLEDSLNQLTDAMNQLLDGSSKLYEGLSTLLDKSQELAVGVTKLSDGSSQLKAGTTTLSAGTTTLSVGTQELSNGLNTLSANNEALNNGSEQIFNSLLDAANSQLAESGLEVPTLTRENYSEVLDGVIASLDENVVAEQANNKALESVTNAVNEKKDVITEGVKNAVLESVTPQVTEGVRNVVFLGILKNYGETLEDYNNEIQTNPEHEKTIESLVNAGMASDEIKATIETKINEVIESEETKALIETKTNEQIQTLIEQNMASDEVQAQIAAGLEQAKAGKSKLSDLKNQLDSYKEFYTGLNTYTEGVASANEGAIKVNLGGQSLNIGAINLDQGMGELNVGVTTLKNSTPALISGISALTDGAMQLSDGLNQFNEKGVKKLVDAADGDVLGLINHIKAIVQVSKDYTSFSDSKNTIDGQVNFIYRTDAIETEDK